MELRWAGLTREDVAKELRLTYGELVDIENTEDYVQLLKVRQQATQLMVTSYLLASSADVLATNYQLATDLENPRIAIQAQQVWKGLLASVASTKETETRSPIQVAFINNLPSTTVTVEEKELQLGQAPVVEGDYLPSN